MLQADWEHDNEVLGYNKKRKNCLLLSRPKVEELITLNANFELNVDAGSPTQMQKQSSLQGWVVPLKKDKLLLFKREETVNVIVRL